MLLHPYMGVYDVWELAERLKRETGGEIFVLAPPPHVTGFVNDKKEFYNVICALLGKEYAPLTFLESRVEGIVEKIRLCAGETGKAAIKLRNCASAMGNRVFDGRRVESMSDQALSCEVGLFLKKFGIELPQEVIVTAWEDNLITSPSSQLWIPAEPEIPICEGVFDQILHGDEKVFGGSVPTALPDGIAGEFAAASLAIAGFFQKIGYQGRCSFDAIVPAENRGAARVKFVECNGRWGGTSIPMFLYKRVFGADAKGAKNMAKTYIAADYTDARLKGSDFKVLKDILNGYLYNPRTGSGNALLYNAGCLKDFGKFDIIVNGLSRDEVSKFLNFTMPFLFNRFFS